MPTQVIYSIHGDPETREVEYADMPQTDIVALAMEGDKGAVDFLNSQDDIHSEQGTINEKGELVVPIPSTAGLQPGDSVELQWKD